MATQVEYLTSDGKPMSGPSGGVITMCNHSFAALCSARRWLSWQSRAPGRTGEAGDAQRYINLTIPATEDATDANRPPLVLKATQKSVIVAQTSRAPGRDGDDIRVIEMEGEAVRATSAVTAVASPGSMGSAFADPRGARMAGYGFSPNIPFSRTFRGIGSVSLSSRTTTGTPSDRGLELQRRGRTCGTAKNTDSSSWATTVP